MQKHLFKLYIHSDNINFTLLKGDAPGKPEAFSAAYTVEIEGPNVTAMTTTTSGGIDHHHRKTAVIAAGGLELTVGGRWTGRPAMTECGRALLKAMHATHSLVNVE